MYSDGDLDAAVKAGILSPAAAAGFRAFVAREQGTTAVDEEQFRLLTGFNDIFVSIAAILLLGAVGWIGNSVNAAVGGAALAGVSWALAEYFTRRRRMALPSIVLLLSFVGGMYWLSGGIVELVLGNAGPAEASFSLAGCAALTAAATYGHWRRFRVPITVAAGTVTALSTIMFTLLALVPTLKDHWPPLLLIGGLVVFAVAMWWDASDPTRTTRRSDVAFWLHLSASPMIVHPTFKMLGLLGVNETDTARAAAAIGIYLLLALVALAVDRRALLVSALFYVVYAMAALFKAAGTLSASFALTALVIGSALLLLSALWHRVRAAVLVLFPAGLRARLPAG